MIRCLASKLTLSYFSAKVRNCSTCASVDFRFFSSASSLALASSTAAESSSSLLWWCDQAPDPYDLVLGEKSNLKLNAQLQSKPPGKKKRNYNSWNGHGAYPDPTANQAVYNVSVEWNRLRRLAIRLNSNNSPKSRNLCFHGIRVLSCFPAGFLPGFSPLISGPLL